jgi:drug/metabolite transporter (DMT)-like permease
VPLNALRIAALALIVAGVLALVYGGFSYTKDTQHTKLGPIEFTVKDQERVNVPVWAGVGAIAVGTVLLLLPRRKS